MVNVLIAYNNDASVELHNFMQLCADTVKQYCIDHKHTYTSLAPPNLTESEIVKTMPNNQICFIAAHGDADGVYNETDTDVVTTRTTNYVFNNKCFYSVACSCAQNLRLELQRIGVKIFVGYNDSFIVGANEDAFCTCALEGLKKILQGATVATAKDAMKKKYDEVIKALSFPDNTFLLRNKERLIFEGEDGVSLADLR